MMIETTVDPQYNSPTLRGARKLLNRWVNQLVCSVGQRLLRSETFEFDGKTYSQFWHWYNGAYKNERAVEVPIIQHYLEGCDPDRILEVGCVLPHYQACSHRVLDKYEQGVGIVNDDVATVTFPQTFDRIVTISTLEHVGWDEDPRDPDKFFRAVDNLVNHLAPGGRLIVTIPIGGNPHLDKAIFSNQLPFHEERFLARHPGLRLWLPNRWHEVDRDAVRGVRYGTPCPNGNAILVGVIHK